MLESVEKSGRTHGLDWLPLLDAFQRPLRAAAQKDSKIRVNAVPSRQVTKAPTDDRVAKLTGKPKCGSAVF